MTLSGSLGALGCCVGVVTRVARGFVFKPKIQNWEHFGGSCNGRRWYVLRTLGPFCGLLLYFIDIRYSLW
jgi:hypothetical protein